MIIKPIFAFAPKPIERNDSTARTIKLSEKAIIFLLYPPFFAVKSEQIISARLKTITQIIERTAKRYDLSLAIPLKSRP